MKPNPGEGLRTYIFYTWIGELLSNGWKRKLEVDDLYEVGNSDRSQNVCSRLEKQWKMEINKKLKHSRYKPSLKLATIKTFGPELLCYGSLAFLQKSSRIFAPLVIGWLIYYNQLQTHSKNYAYVFAFILSLQSIIETLILHYYQFYLQRIGWKMRTAMCSMVYKKVLRLKSFSLLSIGHIVNLCAADAIRFDFVFPTIPMVIVAPCQCVIVVAILWRDMGASVLSGIGCLMAFMTLIVLGGFCFGKLRMSTGKLTGRRLHVMNQILHGIKVVKMYSWQNSFAKTIGKIRRCEMTMIWKSSILRSVSFTLCQFCSKLVILITLIMFVQNGGELVATKVFVAIGLFNQLQFNVVYLFQRATERLSESIISLDRIEEFLLLEETSLNEYDHSISPSSSNKGTIFITNLTAGWNVIKPQLDRVTVSFSDGSLSIVAGKTGSGKTALLYAILGEMPLLGGNIQISGKISYVPQVPWLLFGTLRENILFGEAYDEERYYRVIDACGLKKDIAALPERDSTFVGERGMMLSGGQKARIGLARAVYRQDCDIFLLDDPLSAVDAKVAKHLFEQCIVKFLKNKTRILVTHQLKFLHNADRVYLVQEGKIQEKSAINLVKENLSKFDRIASQSVCDTIDKENLCENEVEENSNSDVGWKVYFEYFRFEKNYKLILLMITVAMFSHSTFILCDWWIGRWVENKENLTSNNATVPYSQLYNTYYINWYTVILSLFFLSLLIRCILHFYICVTSGIEIHNNIFKAVLNAPMRFFDLTPIGKTLNRFSKDMNQIDELLPNDSLELLHILGNTISIIIFTCVVNYFVIIIAVPLLPILFIYRKYYLKTSKDVKRLEGASTFNTRSPIYSLISSTIEGLTTIRAHRLEERFVEMFNSYQDKHNSAWFTFIASSRWMAVRLDLLSCAFVSIVAFATVAASTLANIDSSNAGLILVNLIMLLGTFQRGVKISTDVENLMTSVERVQQYSKITPEVNGSKSVPLDWPLRGNIEFKDFSFTHYSNGPVVLKNINLMINHGEMIGIAGRTGSGKSSLISALFRFNKPFRGDIIINGVPLSSVHLDDLRRALSIVPQEPILFSGTLRYNLDPFNQYSDDEIWLALEHVQMKQNSNKALNLGSEVNESGSNFSIGQKQLICLARAILKKSKIIILDETNANIDFRTDEIIQSTIRKRFRGLTVLTISHRIHTLLKYDKILVLDGGSVVEFDTPNALLRKREGEFFELMKVAGIKKEPYL